MISRAGSRCSSFTLTFSNANQNVDQSMARAPAESLNMSR